ncbi:hypothetical protein GOP47_0005779 [Adiantum capillus-veneris]|uniref:Uncharacterized protein n=1 Tax=Adiantum capillus-veneris TaxID=13818 RepID=A0A9D4V6D8_ADICA|nr:hypothetical protein GOP47_0005779 [Adiantum capillus-veneris]
MEPSSTSRKSTPSSMSPIVPSTEPGMSSLGTSIPHMAPSSNVPTTSSLVHTTSFVAESSLGREAWERRPITRSVVGFHYQTIVDVFLVDISQIDNFALDRIQIYIAKMVCHVVRLLGLSLQIFLQVFLWMV